MSLCQRYLVLIIPLFALAGCDLARDSGPATVEAQKSNDSPAVRRDGIGGPILVEVEGVRQPAVKKANEVDLPDDTAVIGVTVGNHHRAYVLDAMSVPENPEINVETPPETVALLGRHVVNDLIDGVPITATYCDSAQCARVFTADAQQALDIGVGGFGSEGMLLLYGGQRFPQKGSPTNLKVYPFKLTTWGTWVQLHPTTDVYVGAGLSER